MDIFSVLIVIAVLAIAIFKQYNKGTVASQPVKKRMAVPPSVVEEEEKSVPVEKPRVRMQHSPLHNVSKKPERVKSVPEPGIQKEKDVLLRTPADARRAFIYSEIFKRKYD